MLDCCRVMDVTISNRVWLCDPVWPRSAKEQLVVPDRVHRVQRGIGPVLLRHGTGQERFGHEVL